MSTRNDWGIAAGLLVVLLLVAAGLTGWMMWTDAEARKRAEAERQDVQRAEELVTQLHDLDEENRRLALQAMIDSVARDGPESATFRIGVPALIDYIVTSQRGAFVPGYPVQALEVLAEHFPHEVIPLVAGRMSDKDATIRRTAVFTLCKHCSLDKPAAGEVAAPFLVATLADDVIVQSELHLKTHGTIVNLGPVAVPHLARMLERGPPSVRKQAARILALMGGGRADGAVPALIAALDDPDRKVRVDAADTLGMIGPPAKDAIPKLITLLTEGSEEHAADSFRTTASVESLSRIDDKWNATSQAKLVYPKVLEQLKSQNRDARRVAAAALGHFGASYRSTSIPALMAAAVSEDALVQHFAFDALCRIDPAWFSAPEAKDGLAPVTLALSGTDTEVRAVAARIIADLAQTVPETMPILIKAAADEQSGVRITAIRALKKCKPITAEAVTALAAALKDPNPDQRIDAARSLTAHGQEAKAAIPALLGALGTQTTDDEVTTALTAIDPKWQASDAAKAAVRAFAGKLHDKSAAIRQQSAKALSRIGPTAKPAAPQLIARLSDPDLQVCYDAKEALNHTDPEWAKSAEARRAVPDIVAGLKSKDERVREQRRAVLKLLGPSAADAVPALRAALTDADSRTQGGVMDVLQAIGPTAKDAVPDLVRKLDNQPLPHLRLKAYHALRKIDPDWASSKTVKDILPSLVAGAGNADAKARDAAVEVLGWIGPVNKDVRQVLSAALKDEDPAVRRTAVVVICQLGSGETELVAEASRLKDDPDRNVREEVRRSLERRGATENQK